MKPKLLFLFPEGWDVIAMRTLASLREEFDVVCEGFDLFRFPENANILWFDARRAVTRLARKYRSAGLAGVVSTNEQYGALIAALVARELGLPGTNPLAIFRAQHKYYAREAMAQALPEATPAFVLLPYVFGKTVVADHDPGLPYPFFVKPIKAAYSVLARRVDDADALQRHLTFGRWETHIIKRLVRPFADLMREYTDLTIDPTQMMGESLQHGVQLNIDGWMDRGSLGFFGIVEAEMYPGTAAFARFEYPSRLPAADQERAFAVAERAIRAIGFDHGTFNVELFYDPATGSLQIIEINPRLAAQFGDLYEKVDGANPYDVLVDLAVGRPVQWRHRQGAFGAAASFVFREFGDAIKVVPARADLDWLATTHPDARLQTFIKQGNSRWRETRWLGNYRFAIVNMGGTDREDLFRRFGDVCRHVAFERDRPVRLARDFDALRPGD